MVEAEGNDSDKQLFASCEAARPSVQNSNDPMRIRGAIDSIGGIIWSIRLRSLSFLQGWFEHLSERSNAMNEQATAQALIVQGKKAIAAQDVPLLCAINGKLMNLLPNRERPVRTGMVGFH